jgi:hypothetical protein
MATYNQAPIIHSYKEVKRYKSTIHYQLVNVFNDEPQLSKKLNLSKDRNCAKSSPSYWIKERTTDNKKWQPQSLTGLFSSPKPFYYTGDANKRKHLLIFKFSHNANNLLVYYYKDFYTPNFNQIINHL